MLHSFKNGIAAVLRTWVAVLAAAVVLMPGPAAAQDAKAFSNEQLEQLVAPIALYPDALLSQVLMASTYPADVVAAAKWSKDNPKQQGDAAVKAVEGMGWDPSVASLVAFPQAIQALGGQPEQVQKLGDAFLGQSKDVMDAVQRLRAKANSAGNLKSNEQQKIVTEPAPAGSTQQTVIKIEPTNPEVVYVPSYNPTVVYGAWAYPAYPPYYWPPPVGYYPGAALATGIAFGIGVGVVNSLWGNANWGGGDVNINVNKYNNINQSNRISNTGDRQNWNHNASNRKGVPYGDNATRQKFDRQAAGAADRQNYRGHTDNRTADNRSGDRARAEQTLQQRGLDPAQGRDNLARDPATRDSARAAAQNADRSAARDSAQSRQGSQDNAFAGARDTGGGSRDLDRGSSSRASADRGSGAGGSRASASGGGGRSAGGGGRGGGGGGGGRGGGGRR
jgi:hypothetical protein